LESRGPSLLDTHCIGHKHGGGQAFYGRESLRLCSWKIINAHAIALPVSHKHTGEFMFKELSRLLDALCEKWREKVLSISTDGDQSIVGSVRGVATRMENVAKPGCFACLVLGSPGRPCQAKGV
jgi:hypothetical protein